MRRLAVLPVLLLVVAACDTSVPPLSPGSSSPAAATPGPTAPAAITAPPSPSPTPTDDPDGGPPEPDPATFLQVCGAYPGPATDTPIECREAVEAALATVHDGAPSRVDVRYECADAPSCAGTDPDRAFVTLLAGGAATEVELRRAGDGTLSAEASRPGQSPVAPAFTAPAPGRAALPDPPAGLAARSAYPLCGEETVDPDGTHDEAARTCFLTGVLVGSPVEFAETGAGTEGVPFAVLYRFAGSGGVERVAGEGGAWTRSWTGIGPVDGPAVFRLDGLETANAPVE